MKSRFVLQQEAGGLPGPTEPGPPTAGAPLVRPRGRSKTRLSTLDEVAAYLHVSRSTIYRLIAEQGLPCLRVGHVLRFDLAAVLAWAART